jgi:phosphoribosylformylglycinamidine cyclo-ligase
MPDKPSPTPNPAFTYADAGVDLSGADRAKQRIKALAQRTANKNVLSGVGGFGGMFRLDTARYKNPVLVASADGVGTKLKIAFELNLHRTIGADLVNHCVNDIAVQGATPLFFLDYLATGALEPDVVEQVVSGLADACRANGCALLGGETAQMPGFYADGEYDLAGFIVGVVEREKAITGSGIRKGDLILGLPSTGLHTNGYSLARKLFFEVARYAPDQYVNDLRDKAGAALMKTHRSYLKVLRKLASADLVAGMAHITGGGITENLPRILPKNVSASIDLDSWAVPPIFQHLQSLGNIERDEMLRTFNMGIGMICVVQPEKYKRVQSLLNRMGEAHVTIGKIVKGDRKVLYH